jgi:hypothetical protein
LKSLLLTLLLCLCLAVPGTALGNDVDDALQKGRADGFQSLSMEEYYILAKHFRDENKPYSAALFYKLGMQQVYYSALRLVNSHNLDYLPYHEFIRYLDFMAYYAKPFLQTVLEIAQNEGIWYGSDPMRRDKNLEAEGLYGFIDNDYDRGHEILNLRKEAYGYDSCVRSFLELGVGISEQGQLELLADDDFILNIAAVGTVNKLKPHWKMVHEPKDNFCGFARRKCYNQLFNFSQQWAMRSYETTKDKKTHGLERLQQILRKADRQGLPYDKAEAEKDLNAIREYIKTL